MPDKISKELIKAIWANGFLSGLHNGHLNANAYEWGAQQREPENPKEAWDECIEDEYSDKNAEDIKFWEDTL